MIKIRAYSGSREREKGRKGKGKGFGSFQDTSILKCYLSVFRANREWPGKKETVIRQSKPSNFHRSLGVWIWERFSMLIHEMHISAHFQIQHFSKEA